MRQSRRAERDSGKSDVIDARAIARAVLKDGIDSFPAAILDERAMEIRLLNDHRPAPWSPSERGCDVGNALRDRDLVELDDRAGGVLAQRAGALAT